MNSSRRPRTLSMFSLENETCVVTGAARGLGKEFLTAFALSGARGACVDLSLEDCKTSISDIAEEVKLAYPDDQVPELRAYQCNVAVESEVKSIWSQITNDLGKIDVLVTAAGVCEDIKAEDYEYPQWQRVMKVNLDGSWLFAHEAGRHMLENDIAGSIIMIASVCANKCVRPQKQAAYNASKSAVRMLARSLASEWAPSGIRVNTLSPGYVKTKMTTGLLNSDGQDLMSTWEKDIPMNRMADPQELRGTIIWMASEASSYLNGSDVVVDGGFSVW